MFILQNPPLTRQFKERESFKWYIYNTQKFKLLTKIAKFFFFSTTLNIKKALQSQKEVERLNLLR